MARDISWPVCCSSKNATSSDWRCAYIRLRRSYSTPSETRPAIRRRETLNASRSSPAAAIAPTSGHRSVRPWRIRSMVRPTRKGMITPAPIAIAASAKDHATARL